MRGVSKISITFTVLILLLFGSSGIVTAHCSCSGKMSIVLPTDGNCCPTESSCMDITLWHVSDYVVTDSHHHTSTPHDCTIIPAWPKHYQALPMPKSLSTPLRHVDRPPLPGGTTTVEILRV